MSAKGITILSNEGELKFNTIKEAEAWGSNKYMFKDEESQEIVEDFHHGHTYIAITKAKAAAITVDTNEGVLKFETVYELNAWNGNKFMLRDYATGEIIEDPKEDIDPKEDRHIIAIQKAKAAN